MQNKERNYLFDNLKAILIFLVVTVHLFAAVKKVLGINYIILDMFLLTACSFHMPVFIFVSGYFSKKLTIGEGKNKNLDILMTYFIIQIILMLYNYFVIGKAISVTDLWVPGFSMWYLLSLFLWRYFFADLLNVKHLFLWSILLNVFVMGIEINGALEKAFLKTVCFFVFFLLGYYTTEDFIRKIRKSNKWVSIGILSLCVLSIYTIIESGLLSAGTLRGMMLRSVAVTSELGFVKGYLVYLYLLIVPVLIGIALIRLLPDRKLVFSKYGENTMSIYVGQALIYLLFYKKLLRWELFQDEKIALMTAGVLSIGCMLLCGNTLISGIFNSLIKKCKNIVLK